MKLPNPPEPKVIPFHAEDGDDDEVEYSEGDVFYGNESEYF